MKAIILVGGFGTRLRSVLPDVPKPMAPILADKPFLAYLLDYLQQQGIRQVIFSVHYRREKIQDYFKAQYRDISIEYAIEDEPLGTGGAIVYALSTQFMHEPVFVLNGDTFVKLDYRAMYAAHEQSNAQLSMALREVSDCVRYGKVVTNANSIVEFREKGESGAGLINAGVYLLNPNLFIPFNLPLQFSFENDFLLPHLATLSPQAFIAQDYFIDIGIPDDYTRAQAELPALA